MKFDHLRGTPGSRSRLAAQVWEGAKVGADPATVPEPSEVDVPPALREGIEAAMAKYPDHHSAAIPALRLAQQEHGWLSPKAMLEVATVMRVTPAYLESVASFYDMFELAPAGRHTIYVCTNISCSLRGAQDLLASMSEATGAPVGGSSPDGIFHLRAFECLGACDIAPMASIDGYYRGPLSGDDVLRVIEDVRAGRTGSDLLPDRSYEGDYRHRLGERHAAESEGAQ